MNLCLGQGAGEGHRRRLRRQESKGEGRSCCRLPTHPGVLRLALLCAPRFPASPDLLCCILSALASKALLRLLQFHRHCHFHSDCRRPAFSLFLFSILLFSLFCSLCKERKGYERKGELLHWLLQLSDSSLSWKIDSSIILFHLNY